MQHPDPAVVRADFDRIASLQAELDDALDPLERWLIDQAPPSMRAALDVGCGLGTVTRALASRAGRVVGLDLSPVSLREAQRRTSSEHVSWVLGDLLDTPLPGPFDCVVSVAMLHHVPLRPALQRLAGLLRPGGTLLLLDVDDGTRLLDLPRNALGWLLRARRTTSPELARAWAAHGAHETIRHASEVRAAARDLLPGARVRRHIGWRWSLVWHRPTVHLHHL